MWHFGHALCKTVEPIATLSAKRALDGQQFEGSRGDAPRFTFDAAVSPDLGLDVDLARSKECSRR